MTKFYFAAADTGDREIFAFPGKGLRDEKCGNGHEWHALDSKTARKCAERSGRLYLNGLIQPNDLPDCTTSRIHWVFDGEQDAYYRCRVARLCAW